MGTQKVDRVVIDTNVMVSALLFGGTPGELIPLWKSGRIKPLASADIIDEYIKVLAYPKFKLSEEEIHYLLYFEILPYFDVLSIRQAVSPIIKADTSDDKFILCADFRHLLSLKQHKKIRILNPEQFLKNMILHL